jgi:tetratricopeptide (TPR) repeat protein
MANRTKILDTAERYVRSGNLEAAIAEFEKLLGGGEDDVAITNIIGDLNIRLGRREQGIAVFLGNAGRLEKKGAYAQALAVMKKVVRLAPSDSGIADQTGDLYARLGFVPEAKAEFLRAAGMLTAAEDREKLLSVFKKLTKLDPDDEDVLEQLGRLHAASGHPDEAVSAMNAAAVRLVKRENFQKAEKILYDALVIKPTEPATISALARLYLRERRADEALTLVRDAAKQYGAPELWILLAEVYTETGRDAEAREILLNRLTEDPADADARSRLGWLEVRAERPDEAYAYFEPLVAAMLAKGRTEKAIGLLGLILMSGSMHLPTLEKLASIYRFGGQRPSLEVADKVLFAEYRRLGREDLARHMVRELAEICPDDPAFAAEFALLGLSGERPAEASRLKELSGLDDRDRNMIQTNLARAELYIQQGLIRNARRILEHLQMLYPDEPRSKQKLELLKNPPFTVEADDIPELIEEVSLRETDVEDHQGTPFPEPGPGRRKKVDPDKNKPKI